MAGEQPLEYGHERTRKWVTVASFSNSAMANVAKLQLDAEEIPNYLDNEHSATMLWHIQPAVGGVRVKVPEEFEDQALEILRNEDPDPEDQDQDDEYDYDDDQSIAYANVTRCPKCHSTDTEPLSWGWRLVQAAVVLVIGMMAAFHPWVVAGVVAYVIYFLWTKPSHRCFRCRHRFNATATAD